MIIEREGWTRRSWLGATGLTLVASAFPGGASIEQQSPVLSPRMHEYVGLQRSGFIFDETYSTLDEFIVCYNDGSEYPLGLRLCDDGVLVYPEWLSDSVVNAVAQQGRWERLGNKLLRRLRDSRATCDVAQTVLGRLKNDFGVSSFDYSPAIVNRELMPVCQRLSDLSLLDRPRTRPFGADVGFQAGDWHGDWNGTFAHMDVHGAETCQRTMFEKHLTDRGAVVRTSSKFDDRLYRSIDNVDQTLFLAAFKASFSDA